MLKIPCRNITKVMNSPVDIAVGFPVDLIHPLNDLQRLLGGGSIIKVNKRLVIYLLLKNGKIIPYFIDIESQNNSFFYAGNIKTQNLPAFHCTIIAAAELAAQPLIH